MAETNGQHGFGELSKDTARLEEYEQGSWICFFEKGNIFQEMIEYHQKKIKHYYEIILSDKKELESATSFEDLGIEF